MANIAELVRGYIKARDKKGEMTKRHKEELVPINVIMLKIEGMLQRQLQEQNVDSMKTPAGTAYLQTVSSCTVKDWDETLKWIKENDEWAFLDARVNKTAVKDYMESEGDVPPGVDYSETIVTRVRRT